MINTLHGFCVGLLCVKILMKKEFQQTNNTPKNLAP